MTDPEAVPFPVEAAYRIRADVVPLRGTHTVLDGHAAAYAAAKRSSLRAHPERCRVFAPWAERRAITAALGRLAEVIAREHPGIAAGVRLRRRTARSAAALADDLALAIQEDFVVMRADRGAELLHVCFPSRWAPEAHAGSSLAALHAPVPHGERLRSASANLLNAMVHKGPFERFVWSVNASGALALHPREPRVPPAAGALLGALWFRVERQTTLPLPDLGRSVFTIRIFQASLEDVLRVEQGRAAKLAQAISSMDGLLRDYKGIGGFADRLCAELMAFERRPRSPAGT